MAKETKPAEEAVESAPPPKKNKKLIIIIVAAVFLLVLLGGGGAYFLLKKKDHGGEDDEAAEEVVKPKKSKKSDAHPVFVNLDTFTVNLVPETGDQYLQVVLSLELEDSGAEAVIKAQMPKIRNNVTLLLSSKKASELMPKEGKQALANALKAEINAIIEPPTRNKKGELTQPEGPVVSVLFTSFIIQ